MKDKTKEGTWYGGDLAYLNVILYLEIDTDNLRNANCSPEDFKEAIEYDEWRLKMAKEVGDSASEGIAYGNLGSAYHRMGDFKTAIEYHERRLKIAKEVSRSRRQV